MTNTTITLNGYLRTNNEHEYIANSPTREVSAYLYGDGQALYIVEENGVEVLNTITSESIAMSALLQFARGL